MVDIPVIDCHMHAYHTPEAGRQAMSQIPSATGYVGTVEETLAALKKVGMARGVMVNTLPVAFMREAAEARLAPGLQGKERERAQEEIVQTLLGRLRRRNEWSCQVAKEHPALIATITLDPVMGREVMVAEIQDKVKNGGARGIKLHPPIGRFYPSDRALWPAYETAAALGVPVVFHAGLHPHPSQANTPVEYAHPQHFEAVLRDFPRLTAVLAHMAVGTVEEFPHLFRPYLQAALALAKKYPQCHFDTCATLGAGWTEAAMAEAIRQVGAERVLFGSDFPWYEPAQAAQALLGLKLSQEEKRLILGENARRVFKLPA